jgi:hypothetical protein
MSTAVLLDLDGTIIGDINAAVCEFEILLSYCPQKLPLFKAMLTSQLQSTAIIRPGFDAFMRALQRRDIDVFVYTASDTKWAKLLVPLIEQVVGVPFAKPLFTRTHCRSSNGNYVKPCKAVMAAMCASMKKRSRPGIQSAADLADRVMYVDNNDVIRRDVPYAPELILCPTYDYRLDHDVLRLVPENVFVSHWQGIYAKLVQYELMPRLSGASKDAVRIAYYKSLARALNSQRVANKVYVTDVLWLTLRHVFERHNPKSFKGKMLQYITRKCQASLPSPSTPP